MGDALVIDGIMFGSGGGSGTGGHTIQDADGTDLNSQPTLQFKGGLKATNDSTNNKTVVDATCETIDWEDWIEMSSQEQEAYKIAHPDLLILDAPGADGNISADLLTELWSNPDSTATFAAQNISLSSSDYDFLLFIYRMYVGGELSSAMTSKGEGVVLNGSTPNIRYREITRTNDTTFAVGVGKLVSTYGTETVNNNQCIPVAVYGLKKTVNLNFSAIASDVSTSADKCMLSDGVTSVEDALNEASVSGTIAKGTGVSAVPSLLKKNGVAYISGFFEASSSPIAVNQILGTVPEGYRPTTTRFTPSYPASVVRVDTNGKIYPTMAISGTRVYISVSYPVV